MKVETPWLRTTVLGTRSATAKKIEKHVISKKAKFENLKKA
jgi:hypothetical protein